MMIAFDWFLDVLKNRYVKFSGRAGRPEYWFFFLFVFVIGLVLSIIDSLVLGLQFPILTLVFYLAILLPQLALCIRRFHDQDRSGWFVLLGLIPFIGGIIILIFMILPGTPGDNRFGPPAPTSPKK